MIKPEVGRHVHFYNAGWVEGDQPLAAIIAKVHDDRNINIAAFDDYGNNFPQAGGVPLIQPEDETPEFGPYCKWMPFQVQSSGGVADALNAARDVGEDDRADEINNADTSGDEEDIATQRAEDVPGYDED